ncbi:MAG: DUF302 domain-containing protein [Halococcoides sp.]
MTDTTRTTVTGDFDAVVEATIDALGDEGFGVLTDIDMQATFAAKLDEQFRQYRILGACNPSLAHKSLTEEIELGALLPCNVIVYEDGDSIVVAAVDPQQLVGLADNDALDPIASEVDDRLRRALDGLPDRVEA